MKIYTLFTPSHQQMHDDWFLKTLPEEDNLELDETFINQTCESASFFKEGWEKTTFKKIETFLRAAEENDGEYFIFSDVDVQFFDSFKNDLINHVDGYDMAIQNDNDNQFCTGFFICQGNEKTRDYFNRMLKRHFKRGFKGDQMNFNTLGTTKHLNLKFLPFEKYWNVFQKLKKSWDGKKDFNIPKNILMHHANWTVGVGNKIKLLKKVREKYKENQ